MYWYNKMNFLTVRKKPHFQSRLFSLPCATGYRINAMRMGVPLLLASVLVACGGGDDAGSSSSPTSQPPSPVGRVLVTDGFRVAKPNTPTRVDLSAFVRGPGATLTELESDKPQACSAAKISGLTAEVTIRDEYLCRYTLTASNGVSSAKGAIHLLASTRAAPELAPLSHAMRVGEGETTFNLESLFGADWPSGYELDAASLSVQGGNVQGIAVASGNTIRYTPPATSDWDRITFILRSDTRPEENLLGTLFVTVSESVNHPPAIADKKYDFTKHTGITVPLNRTFTVDLSTLPTVDPRHPDDPEWQFIAHPDGQEWQLIEVASYSASVTPSDPTLVTNKRFNVIAATPGNHIVSYIVGDHQGGYSAGVMRINFAPLESAKDWSDITIGRMIFFATPLYSEVSVTGIPAGVMWDTGVNSGRGNSIATLTGRLASAYCTSQGYRLPNVSELITLHDQADIAALRSKYPRQHFYLATENNGLSYKGFDIISGDFFGVASDQIGYVLCVQNESERRLKFIPTIFEPKVQDLNTVLGDNRWWDIGTIVAPNGISALEVDSVYMNISHDPSLNPTLSNFRLTSSVCKPSCTLQAKGGKETVGGIILNIKDAADPDVHVKTQKINFFVNAILTFDYIVVKNNPFPRYDKILVVNANRIDGSRISEDELMGMFREVSTYDIISGFDMDGSFFYGMIRGINYVASDPRCKLSRGYSPTDFTPHTWNDDTSFHYAALWNGNTKDSGGFHPAYYERKDKMLAMPRICSIEFFEDNNADMPPGVFYIKRSERNKRFDFFAIIPFDAP